VNGELPRAVWNNKRVLGKALAVLLLFFAMEIFVSADELAPGPKLLLNAQRLRRLKRDRERKTMRWVNFENRVNKVPDSPERGFELALFYAVTGDETKGREAVTWALSHNSARQKALVLDWCAPLLTIDQRNKLATFGYIDLPTFQIFRDAWFLSLASGMDVKPPAEDRVRFRLAQLMDGSDWQPDELYAFCELVYVVRANVHTDLRETDPHYFSTLPSLLLLTARPRELNSPPWILHAAALALVALDPNLPASQFLQSWALEDTQTVREGPGVAYELLWADPYLPGVGYQNMEPWLYDDHAHLFARGGWEPESCWIEISAQGVQQENCPPNWQAETVTFGHLTLIPMTERCVDIPHITDHNQAILIWKLKPGEKLVQGKGKDQHSGEADAAGIWRPGSNIEGKVCAAAH
jgi:hypothetical protein